MGLGLGFRCDLFQSLMRNLNQLKEKHCRSCFSRSPISFVNDMFVYVNLFAFVLGRVLPFQNPMKMIDKDAQGLEQPNSSLGRNLELHDEVMQPCMENFPSYKNVVTCERREECVLQSDQEPLEEIFWESRRNMKGQRIEEKNW